MRPWLFLILGLTILVSFLYRDKSDLEILLDKAEDVQLTLASVIHPTNFVLGLRTIAFKSHT
jgi:hypothetical protein